MRFERSSGILLHPTSLPGPFGVGDLGSEAHKFIDFLESSGQKLWQIMPLGPTGFGNSPYSSFSAFAGNTLLVSPDLLIKDKLLTKEDLKGAPRFHRDRVDFGRVIEFKNRLLARAFENYKRANDAGMAEDVKNFSQFAGDWLDDYALFRAIQEQAGGASWDVWKPELRRRERRAIESARRDLSEKIEAQKFFQYLFFKQWFLLKAYSDEKGIKIIGDMPIFVAYDSADVWAYPELFKLDEEGRPTVVAGVPPDAFSKTGQLWGNPIYNWDRMRETGFSWWIKRMRAALQIVDIVRVDHFRGFAATYEIPAKDETAEHGRWVKAPGRELFAALKHYFHNLPIIAEDLGTITPDVHHLRDVLGLPGMRVLQFAFGGDPRDTHLPHNYNQNTVVYTGTHDNDTVVGWFESKPQSEAAEVEAEESEEKESDADRALRYLNTDGREIHWDFIRAALASVADIAIIPLQDLLGLGSDARMNLPASQKDNWAWRFRAGALGDELSQRLKEMTELYGRG
ncbi:MAG TPA: 4-alpha-glucanotransferase [Blastocatellia bacterium]|nr:4-alpha-glucanotransferase [Blastocatellia bacterium]